MYFRILAISILDFFIASFFVAVQRILPAVSFSAYATISSVILVSLHMKLQRRFAGERFSASMNEKKLTTAANKLISFDLRFTYKSLFFSVR